MTREQRNFSIISTNFACIHSSNLSLTSRITNTTRLVRSHFKNRYLDDNTSLVLDSDLILAREKTNLYLSLCDLLSTFALQHTFRSHFFMLTSSISSHVATLLSSKDKHLRLGRWPFYLFVVFNLLTRFPVGSCPPIFPNTPEKQQSEFLESPYQAGGLQTHH